MEAEISVRRRSGNRMWRFGWVAWHAASGQGAAGVEARGRGALTPQVAPVESGEEPAPR